MIAQGQLLPAGGFVQLAGMPGDIVETIHVEVGEEVSAGTKLVTLRSEAAGQHQLEALNARRTQAGLERSQAILQAKQKVRLAEQQVQHVDAQFAALGRQEKLLELAEQQVNASAEVLRKLEAINRNEQTSEFVGQLEVDRQQLAVSEADLAYRQQRETHLKAVEDVGWARQAAELELEAAREMLMAAEQSTALDVIDAELASLQAKLESSLIVAPTDGVILAINVSEGEASVQLPLVEMADLSKMVCEVEVNEMDAGRVAIGSQATIRSRAFGSDPLAGQVSEKFALVGRPQLKPLDPLARVDYRAITAIVQLDEASSAKARNWLQLQVEVEMAAGE